jgi:hypothetical protein
MKKVNSIEIKEVKTLLKDCPKLVQRYVECLEELLENQIKLTNKAIQKLKSK